MSTQQYAIAQEEDLWAERPGTRLHYVSTAQYSPEWDSSPHTHACAELFFVTGGLGRFQVQQEEFPVSIHDLMVINANVPHTELSQRDNPLEYIVLGVEGLEAVTGITGCALFHLYSGREEFTALLRLLLQEARLQAPGCARACQALCQVILLRLLRLEDFNLTGVPAGPKVSRECELVRRYIDNHFKENLSLDQLSSLAHVNKYYLAHSFRREFGVPPINYLMSRRIQESRFLLLETDYSLSHIAQLLGFSSLSYFSQCFRRSEGVSPMEYRKAAKPHRR